MIMRIKAECIYYTLHQFVQYLDCMWGEIDLFHNNLNSAYEEIM